MNTTSWKKLADEELKASDLNGKAGISAQALPFYAGNKFYLIYLKPTATYAWLLLRLHPSVNSVVKQTTGCGPSYLRDFSVFRIYADANGEPAEYNENNVPLKAKNIWLSHERY